MNRNAWFFVILLSLSIPALDAFAGKESGGGGGDARCAEYSDYVGRIASTLVTIGQPEVNKINAIIQVADLWKIKQSLKCFPVLSLPLDRQAISYPVDTHTDLLVSAWATLTVPQKLRLASHELAILAGYEQDGEYFISEPMNQILTSGSSYFTDLLRADQVINNLDGSKTFLKPFVFVNSSVYYFGIEVLFPSQDQVDRAFSSAATGICRYFGYSSSIGYAQTAWNSTDGLTYAEIADNATLHGVWTKQANGEYRSSIGYFATLTCK